MYVYWFEWIVVAQGWPTLECEMGDFGHCDGGKQYRQMKDRCEAERELLRVNSNPNNQTVEHGGTYHLKMRPEPHCGQFLLKQHS